MQINSKTFRLFISSTFSDFQVEREILQTKVFPNIKEYCSTKGYTFQPIDLRWGVNNEAQLDQKALEMCIKEVQSCKTHDYPNFLIMLGDRYGWVPLPNIIEKSEFEQIIQNLDTEDKEYLFSWYDEDANQIPISYILKQRTSEYEDYDKWLELESKLRDIFQNAVSDLDENFKKKYFTSATESEAIEGIISYSRKSKFQQKLIQLIPDLEQIDHKNIFGFFRNIEKSSIIEDKSISTDYDKAQLFKEQVQAKLIDKNILNVSTTQISKDQLDTCYLDTFIISVTNFLKQLIDNQISKDNEKDYSDLEMEKLQQRFFIDQKLENFLDQEKILQEIQNYISDEKNKPLIVCGQSGIGKSSIMAKAIEETSIQTSKKIVYRFIGATPNSTNTIDLLTSILEELNITIEDDITIDNENSFLTNIDKEENAFTDFSNTVYEEINNIKDDIVIFIDAVDQLTNDDQFLWLPNKLPSNIKIVISALKDEDYKEDCKYFYILEDKIPNFIEIEPFNKSVELLELLLSQQNRTLQLSQKKYFVEQYNKVKTPFYVYMAANQMQYWKSSDTVDTKVTLGLSQKDIVKDFIEGLNAIHHHDKLLVRKVFGYILASKDGLSEYEILELLNTDKEFIKHLAPDTWHTNTTQELPLVIWTRFYNHIKPFLIKRKQDDQELLYFFHREFIDIIENKIYQQKEHEKIIEATQELILNHQDQEFNNRLGNLYCILITQHYIKYKKIEKIKYYCQFISTLNYNLSKEYRLFIRNIAINFELNNKSQESLDCKEIEYFTTSYLYNKNNEQCSIEFAYSIYLLALQYYMLTNIDTAKKLMSESLDIDFANRHDEDIDKVNLLRYELLSYLSNDNKSIDYIQKAISIKNNYELSNCHLYNRLAMLYFKLGDFKSYQSSYDDGINILNKYVNKTDLKIKYFYIEQIIKYALLKTHSDINSAVEIVDTFIDEVDEIYSANKKSYISKYIEIYTIIITIYSMANLHEKALNLNQKTLDIVSDLYIENKQLWLNNFIILLQNKAYFLRQFNLFFEYRSVLYDILKQLKPFYENNKKYWYKRYEELQMEIQLFPFTIFGKVSNENNENENLESIENLYNKDNVKYIDIYSDLLYKYSNYHISVGENNEAKKLLYLNIDIRKKEFEKDQGTYTFNYIMALVILSKAYTLKIQSQTHNIKKIILLLEEIYETIHNLVDFDKIENLILCSDILNSLMNYNRLYGDIEKAMYYNKIDLEITKKLYHKDKNKFFDAYSHSIKHLGLIYKKKKDTEKYTILLEESNVISADYYDHKSTLFANKYLTIKKNFKDSKNDLPVIFNELQIAKKLYYRDKGTWSIHYINYLSFYIEIINNIYPLGDTMYEEEDNYLYTKQWVSECKEVINYINSFHKNKFPEEVDILKTLLTKRKKSKNKYYVKLLLLTILTITMIYFVITYLIVVLTYVFPILFYLFSGIIGISAIVVLYQKLTKK